jgi:hypothetical protein
MSTIRPNRSYGSASGGSGQSTTEISGPLSGFGELEIISPTPTSQISFVYGINPLLATSQTYGAGSTVSSSGGEVIVSSGTASNSYARVISKKVAKYRPGQATLARWTARYSAGVSNNRQMSGIYNIEGGYRFGYNGEQFGILYTESATIEVQTLTITTKSSAATNVTVTLDGGPGVVVPVTNGANTSITAYEISLADYSQVAGGWDAIAIQNVVYFTRRIAGPAGASSFDPGVSGAVGSFAILTTGVAPSDVFIAQQDWNRDTCNGAGLSRVNIDHTKGNIYQVQFQYLGYGNAFFSVINGETGRPVLCHVIENANTRTSTNLRNPNLYLSWESVNNGSTTPVSLRGASGGTFVEGAIKYLGAQFSITGTKSIGASVETPILTLRASNVLQGRKSMAQLQIDRISVACDGAKPVDIKVYKNVNLVRAQFQKANLIASASDVDSAASSFSIGSGVQIFGFSVSKTGNSTESLTDLDLFLQSGDTVTITAFTANPGGGGGGSDVSASIVWIEDI